jgi:MFS superfamily sulfate permease-like transporter
MHTDAEAFLISIKRKTRRFSIQIGLPAMSDGSATVHMYRPKIATVLVEGYDLGCFRRDMLAALTVAIVALPLSMAIAAASGVSPEHMPPSLAAF